MRCLGRTTWALMLAGPAAAQSLTIHDGWLLEAQPGSIYENGVGSPTVAYDRAADTWVMFFETRFGEPDEVCRDGRWGIGRATSPDGLTWTVDPTYAIEPEPGTFYDCVVAHPTVLFDGTTWKLWFKAQQANDACDDTGLAPPDWGCNAVTGVGSATSTDGVDFTIDPFPALNLGSFGFPSVTEVDGVLRMLLAYSNDRSDLYEVWESVSIDDGITWTTPELVIQPGFAPWVQDEIFNPAVTCDGRDAFPYTLWAGGRDTEPDGGRRLLTAGLGRAFSTDGVRWPWDASNPWIVWDLDPVPPDVTQRDWRHWDAVRIDEDFLLFFSQKDESDRNRVGLAYTYSTQQSGFDTRRLSNRICSTTARPGDTGDTDDTADTGVVTDTDRPVDTDTDGPDAGPRPGGPEDGCACDASGAAPVGLLALLPLAWRRRRR